MIEIPVGALVVLAGPSGSGKSTWAASRFRPDQVVSTDDLRGLVGLGTSDQRAGTDAFAVLDLVVDRRLRRGLTTVIDSLGLDAKQRARWIGIAARHDRPTVAIAFDAPDKLCRARNSARPRPVPSKALTSQLKRWPDERAALADMFDEVHHVDTEEVDTDKDDTSEDDTSAGDGVEDAGAAERSVRLVPPALHVHRSLRARQKEHPMSLRFGLSISSFTSPVGTEHTGPRLAALAADAEAAGFHSLWVMDHMMQIPQVGRAWDPMLESTTTLGFLAAATERIRLGTLVTGITYRNVAHVGKIAATLDVLSGGRAVCGLGAAWFDREHRAYGWTMPPLTERYELLEDALELFPLLWGPGTPSFSGRHIEVAEAICYPRPIQDPIPILVGGSGERRTLQLVARHADACNLFGEPDVVRHKIDVLHRHCETESRDPADITITQLSSVLCSPSTEHLDTWLAAHSNDDLPAEHLADRLTAGTVDEHIGRLRALTEAGVQEVVVSLADIGEPGAIERFAPVIAAFS